MNELALDAETTSDINAETRLPLASRPPIRVFVAEDHHITLWGLSRLIQAAEPPMEMAGSATSCDELLHHDGVRTADVILLELTLGGRDTSECLAHLRQRCTGRVLVLTASHDTDRYRAVMVRGARGVVHKSEQAETILRAIEKVHRGELWLQGVLLGEVLDVLTADKQAIAPQLASRDERRIASLTAREREIVVAMMHRTGDKQLAVADELCISEHTLRNHLSTIYGKLGVRGRLELHIFSTLHGLGSHCQHYVETMN